MSCSYSLPLSLPERISENNVNSFTVPNLAICENAIIPAFRTRFPQRRRQDRPSQQSPRRTNQQVYPHSPSDPDAVV